MAWAAGAAAIAGPLLGGIIGQQTSAANRAAAQQAAQEAYDEIAKLNAPPDQSKAIILEKFKQAGLYTPELEKQVSAGTSQVSQISEDPTLRQAQMGALNQLQERASNGLNASDRQALNEERNQVATDTQGRLGALQQQMQSRGIAGSGSELASALSQTQGAQNAEGAASDRIAAQAQQAALQAAMNSGQLGGNIRSQDFGVNQAKANAADQFKLFDVQNSIAQQARNVGNQNTAQQQNLATAQNVGNANTTQANNEAYRQSAAQRQYWQDQAQLAGMKSNARLGQSNNLNQQADATAQAAQTMGSGVGAAAGGIYGAMTKKPDVNYYSAPSPSTTVRPNAQSDDNSPPLYYEGGMIPGQSNIPGDNPENDKVHALLSPGEVVIPKSVVDHGPDAAYGFLHALINKHKRVK